MPRAPSGPHKVKLYILITAALDDPRQRLAACFVSALNAKKKKKKGCRGFFLPMTGTREHVALFFFFVTQELKSESMFLSRLRIYRVVH